MADALSVASALDPYPLHSQPKPVSVSSTQSMPYQKRPFGVTLLLWMVLSLSAWGAVRLFTALRWWDVLYEFEARLSPLYLSITGAVWILAGGVLVLSMVRGKMWARPATLTSILLWLIEYWIERIFFETPRANLPFVLVGSAVILVIALIASFRQSTKSFFTRSEEHEQPDEATIPE
jgi:hypothetical protein